MKTGKLTGCLKREQVKQFGYYKDPRWKQVSSLRKENKIPESNNLVFQIRNDFGLE